MGEFKYIEGLAKDIQKTLNQWKHGFKITPIETKIYSAHNKKVEDDRIAMLLWREHLNPKPKGEQL